MKGRFRTALTHMQADMRTNMPGHMLTDTFEHMQCRICVHLHLRITAAPKGKNQGGYTTDSGYYHRGSGA